MWVGKEALTVLLFLGGVTGVILYYSFYSVIPVPGIMYSMYKLNLTPKDFAFAAANPQASASGEAGAVSGPVGASLTIPPGASVQGNPSYSPDTLTVKKGDSVAVTNKDSVPHTVTNGKDSSDPTSGKLFDTSIVMAGASAQFGTTKLAAGNYPFHCTLHPYMTGLLKVQ
jgi:plastocyanin